MNLLRIAHRVVARDAQRRHTNNGLHGRLFQTAAFAREDNKNKKGDDKEMDLDSIFEMLDLSPKSNNHTLSLTKEAPVKDKTEEEVDMDDLFAAIDSNSSMKSDSGKPESTTATTPSSNIASKGDDSIAELEKILADFAAEETKVYEKNRPAPRFWKTDDKKMDAFLRELDPESLFKPGPHSSAFSPRKLVGDKTQISKLAARIHEQNKKLERIQSNQDRDSQAPSIASTSSSYKAQFKERSKSGLLASKDLELEQNQLSQLSHCQSITALSAFVYKELLTTSSYSDKGMGGARPGQLVYAETMRLARELQAPYIAYSLYRHCHTHMSISDKLLVLGPTFYEELLTTAWNSLQDISAVVSVIQDIIGMGVIANRRLSSQIDKIVVDLNRTYNMPALSKQLLELSQKVSTSAAG